MSYKQLDAQIMGQNYILGCPEGGEDRLLAAVRRVDEAMCKIRDAGKIKARDRIAVLAALNLTFDHTEVTKHPATAHAPMDDLPETLELRLSQLLTRLDKALEQDGHLI